MLERLNNKKSRKILERPVLTDSHNFHAHTNVALQYVHVAAVISPVYTTYNFTNGLG